MKITLGNVAVDTSDVLRFEKYTRYEIPMIEIITKANTKTGEATTTARFNSDGERDAAYEKLVELWSDGKAVRI